VLDNDISFSPVYIRLSICGAVEDTAPDIGIENAISYFAVEDPVADIGIKYHFPVSGIEQDREDGLADKDCANETDYGHLFS
jgi:hypothetical protein